MSKYRYVNQKLWDGGGEIELLGGGVEIRISQGAPPHSSLLPVKYTVG